MQVAFLPRYFFSSQVDLDFDVCLLCGHNQHLLLWELLQISICPTGFWEFSYPRKRFQCSYFLHCSCYYYWIIFSCQLVFIIFHFVSLAHDFVLSIILLFFSTLALIPLWYHYDGQAFETGVHDLLFICLHLSCQCSHFQLNGGAYIFFCFFILYTLCFFLNNWY